MDTFFSLTLCTLNNFTSFFFSSADFFKINLLKTNHSVLPLNWQTVWFQIQSGGFVGQNLGSNCLSRLLAGEKIHHWQSKS